MTALADSALSYAQTEGLHVFPLQERGKQPLVAHGLDDATMDPLTIEAWWDRWPNANIAIRTGDIVVVDEDEPGALAALAFEHGQKLPTTRVAKTGKGRHYYFTQPSDTRIRNTAGRLAQGIDTRGDGGYVVAPPSIHPDGGVYQWESTAPPVVFPDWMVLLLAKPQERSVTPFAGRSTPYATAALEQEFNMVAFCAEGGRNAALNAASFSLAQLVAGGELDEQDMRSTLERAARACGLPDKEALATINSGVGAGLLEPRRAPESNGNGVVHQLRPATADPTAPAQPTDRRLVVEDYSTFYERGQGEIEFLVDGLWPTKTFTFIASPPKKGKTWIGLSAALSIATGKPFLKEYDIPQPRRVLYLALEGARQALLDRLGALSRGMEIDPDPAAGELDNLQFIYRPRGINLADPEWAADLTNLAAEEQYAVIFVDVMRAAARFKESDATDFSLLRSYLEPAMHHCSIAMLHHFTKLSEISRERDAMERMSGSGAMGGALDVGIFIIGSERGARDLKLTFDTRDIAGPDDISVRLEGAGSGHNDSLRFTDTAFWRSDIPDVPAANIQFPADDLAAWILKQPQPVTIKEVATHFDCSIDTVSRRKDGLVRAGVDWHLESNKVWLRPAVEEPSELPQVETAAHAACGSDDQGGLSQSQTTTATASTASEACGSTESGDLQGEATTASTAPLRGVPSPPVAAPPELAASDPDDLFGGAA